MSGRARAGAARPRHRRLRAAFALLVVAAGAVVPAATADAARDPAPPSPVAEAAPVDLPPADGREQRIETPHGPIRLYIPHHHGPLRATVVYVHGYFTTLDEAWEQHRLAAQFAASGVPALFVAPAAPLKFPDPVRFPDLGELLDLVRKGGVELPDGPLVVVGHSGAFRTILEWLGDSPPIRTLVLVDGLYRSEKLFARWLRGSRRAAPRQLVLVSYETEERARALLAHQKGALDLPEIPETDVLDDATRAARLVHLRSQHGHMELVTDGKVLPLLVRSFVP